jgi:ABC-type bacteriocin/lantibiotic exporter with double-glycine peptidase domain
MDFLLKHLIEIIVFLPNKLKKLSVPIGLMIISTLLSLTIPLFIMKIIDKLKIKSNSDIKLIILILIGWLSVILLTSCLEYLQKKYFQKYSNDIASDIYEKLLRFYSSQSFEEWNKHNSKELSEKINSDISEIRSVISGDIFLFLRYIFISIISISILILINWKLIICLGLLVPAYSMGYLIWNKTIKSTYKEVRTQKGKFILSIVEYFQTIPIFKVNNTLDNEIIFLKEAFNDYLQKDFGYFKILNTRSIYSKTLSSFAPLYLAFVSMVFLLYNIASIGQIFAFWSIFSMTISSIGGISSLYLGLINRITVFKEIIISINKNEIFKINAKSIKEIDNIVFKNISYSFGNKNYVIKYPSFEIKKGEWIEIRGKSGIGKTTLIRLLLGLLKPLSGSIIVNGEERDIYDEQEYLSCFGYVEQNGYIFSRSIMDNILIGRKFEEYKWQSIIKKVELESLINSYPAKQNQLIGENGSQLSGGEKQKILIARALYGGAKWLFLDEPFTGIDKKNQSELQKVIELMRGEISIAFITHQRIPFLEIDQIIELQDNVKNIQ